MNIKTIERRELDVTELFINDDVTLVYMPDLSLCDFHVKGDKYYMVHFLNTNTFGMEFATIKKGNNIFNFVTNEQTECYLFQNTDVSMIVKALEQGGKKGKKALIAAPKASASPCTGPIVIPPTRIQNPD